MQARRTLSGITVSLNKRDKVTLAQSGRLECILSDEGSKDRSTTFALHVLDEVKEGFLEEPGFHAQATPQGAGFSERERYDVYLSKERFTKLVNPPQGELGYTGSRCRFDRIDFSYFDG